MPAAPSILLTQHQRRWRNTRFTYISLVHCNTP